MDIRTLRLSTGMTQKAFAEYFKIPVRTIEDWEAGKRKPPVYVVELIEYKIKKEELTVKKSIEIINKAKEIMNGVYVQNIPEIKIGDIVKLGDLWDGLGETPTESYSCQISETDWVNYEFETIEEKEDELETLVKITNIDIV